MARKWEDRHAFECLEALARGKLLDLLAFLQARCTLCLSLEGAGDNTPGTGSKIMD